MSPLLAYRVTGCITVPPCSPGFPRLNHRGNLDYREMVMSGIGVRREKAALSSGCKSHPATAPAGSNRSSYGGNEVAEAFGMRVTIYGDSASVQAVTRVNAEQASKRPMRRPTRQPFRGRLIRLGE